MIPKVIHYCWFSDDEKPEKIQKCIESWKEHLPDFDIKCWNYNNFPRGKSKWVDEAVDSKKFAFAADYIRCYALFHEGGVYLDSDVEVKRDLSPLLKYPYFLGKENDGLWEAAVIGAVSGMHLFEKLIEYYDTRSFKLKRGYDVTPLPRIMSRIGEQLYDVQYIDSFEEFMYKEKTLQIVPYDYFSPKSYSTGLIDVTKRTFTIHHFTASWHGGKERLYELAVKLLGNSIAKFLSMYYKKLNKMIP